MLSKFLTFTKSTPLRRSFSLWKDVEMGPTDPILGITEAFKKDPAPNKVGLDAGAYRDDNGKPWVLPSVKKADDILIHSNYNYEYLPIVGLQSFIDNSVKLALGPDAKSIKENRVAGIQSLSGTGACRVAGDFFRKFLKHNPAVYLPNPTWPNHKNIFHDAGLQIKEYRYYEPKTKGLNFDGLIDDLKGAAEKSVILFHACAHNPTGVDPTESQWQGILDVCKQRHHIVLFDMAYQGYTSGNCDKDAYAVRLFEKAGIPIITAQSFAKNFGLYGQRVGALSLICSDQEEKGRVLSQLKLVARPMYSNPPLAGARIVDTILSSPELTKMWHSEIQTMADRIANMRLALVDGLKKLGNPHDWSHITDQKGMFAYTGLTKEQVLELAEKYHIYLVHSGRISIAGLNTKNVGYVAEAFDAVTKNKKL